MMIDWVTCKAPFYYPGIISGGQFISLDVNGEIEHSTPKRRQFVGSWESSMTARTVGVDNNGDTCLIELSGNPVKFLQGHNLWGSDNLPALVYETVLKISSMLDVIQPASYIQRLMCTTLSRVDINEQFRIGSRKEALQCLYHIGSTSRTRSKGALTKGSTVYLNKPSKRWEFKFYSKGQELALPRNNKAGLIELPQAALDYADDIIRAELTLKSNELRESEDGLYLLANWEQADCEQIFNDYYERLTIVDQLELQLVDLSKLPSGVRSTYQLWFDGHDVMSIISRPTFYRHRKQLLEHGIDISLSSNKKQPDKANVVPLVRTITLTPATIPDWAFGTDLYFEPRQLPTNK